MRLIDTHAHLDFPALRDQFQRMLANAAAHQVRRIVAIGASRGLQSNYRALDIAQRYDQIRCTAGIHPHDAGMATEEVIETVRRDLAGREQVVAIGEVGLDYYYDHAPRQVQLDVFAAFLRISQEVGKPVVIHSRDAEQDTLELLEAEDVRGGILHCFTGSRPFAEALLERDFYISFSGIVTYESAHELLEIARDVPAERVLFETDSPYLAPVPMRGKDNQPAFVRHTAARIAQIRGVPLAELAEQVWANAARVFDWPEE